MAEFQLLKGKKIKSDASVENYIDSLVKAVKADDQLMRYLSTHGLNTDELIRSNISAITRFKEDRDYCKKCPGFALCNKERPHYVLDLTYDGFMVNNDLKPCKHKLDDMIQDEAYLVRDFPAEWRDSTIPLMDKSKQRLKLIKRYKEALDAHANWLFITGNHRSGKSFVAATLINYFNQIKKRPVAFINYPNRVKELLDLSYGNKEDFFKLMGLYSTVDLLVLDDFGNEYKSEYIRDSVTLAILNERARLGLMTIFTSEFSYEDLANMYALNASGRARGKQLKNLLEDLAGEAIDISNVGVY
ncbi:MAG: hypothetical protein MJ207_03400 [Bacilli bacterium]|nr:hypothetical protein [Bacilli bacterium]